MARSFKGTVSGAGRLGADTFVLPARSSSAGVEVG
jgi:hypothetical protein